MKNGKVFYNNLISGAEIDVSTAADGFGSQYLANNNQGVVWRSTTPTSQAITMTFQSGGTPAALNVKGIVVMNHNLESGDTFLFEASDDVGFASKVDVAIPAGTGYVEVDWTYPYYRLSLSKTAGEYVQVGEIYLLGSAYEFQSNFKWNYSYTREINRNVKQTTSGQVYRRTRFVRRGFNMDFEGLTDTQKLVFEDMAESDYICFLPYGSDGDLYYGVIDFSSFTHVYRDFWNVNLTFMENPK